MVQPPSKQWTRVLPRVAWTEEPLLQVSVQWNTQWCCKLSYRDRSGDDGGGRGFVREQESGTDCNKDYKAAELCCRSRYWAHTSPGGSCVASTGQTGPMKADSSCSCGHGCKQMRCRDVWGHMTGQDMKRDAGAGEGQRIACVDEEVE